MFSSCNNSNFLIIFSFFSSKILIFSTKEVLLLFNALIGVNIDFNWFSLNNVSLGILILILISPINWNSILNSIVI